MNTDSMHDLITVDPDVHPPFGEVNIVHNVPLSVEGHYHRESAGPSNAVLAELTLTDGTQVTVWPDGYMQVTGKDSDTSQLHRITTDTAGPAVTYERTLTSEN
jgi:hypothetical protein